jgi:hypothetical protein
MNKFWIMYVAPFCSFISLLLIIWCGHGMSISAFMYIPFSMYIYALVLMCMHGGRMVGHEMTAGTLNFIFRGWHNFLMCRCVIPASHPCHPRMEHSTHNTLLWLLQIRLRNEIITHGNLAYDNFQKLRWLGARQGMVSPLLMFFLISPLLPTFLPI